MREGDLPARPIHWAGEVCLVWFAHRALESLLSGVFVLGVLVALQESGIWHVCVLSRSGCVFPSRARLK